MVEPIDHAVSRYGKKVKFLNFKEAQERLDKNLLAGNPLRDEKGNDNGVRLLDVNNDGYMDVVIGNDKTMRTRVWSPKQSVWAAAVDFPVAVVPGAKFGVTRPDGNASVFFCDFDDVKRPRAWSFDGTAWTAAVALPRAADTAWLHGKDFGVRLRDLDGDG